MSQPEPAAPEQPAPHESPHSKRLRFELIFASAWLAVGLFLMPAIVYYVGASLLGPYGANPAENLGLGRFYADFFGDLAEPSVRAWSIALGPLILVSLVRAIFIGVRPGESAATQQPRRPPPAEHTRLEPRIDPE
jgi:hypothetical protein